MWAIWLHEALPPEKVEPIDWLLLSNVAIATWQDTTERIGYSCVRPGIERWHKIVKSGCTVEGCCIAHRSFQRLYLPYAKPF
jgi:hypothetical protein